MRQTTSKLEECATPVARILSMGIINQALYG